MNNKYTPSTIIGFVMNNNTRYSSSVAYKALKELAPVVALVYADGRVKLERNETYKYDVGVLLNHNVAVCLVCDSETFAITNKQREVVQTFVDSNATSIHKSHVMSIFDFTELLEGRGFKMIRQHRKGNPPDMGKYIYQGQFTAVNLKNNYLSILIDTLKADKYK